MLLVFLPLPDRANFAAESFVAVGLGIETKPGLASPRLASPRLPFTLKLTILMILTVTIRGGAIVSSRKLHAAPPDGVFVIVLSLCQHFLPAPLLGLLLTLLLPGVGGWECVFCSEQKKCRGVSEI